MPIQHKNESAFNPPPSARQAADRNGWTHLRRDRKSYYLVSFEHHAAGSESHFFGANSILNPPRQRAAYSDRLAWLLAALSDLAYLRFERDRSAREDLGRALAEAGLLLNDTFSAETTGTQAYLATRPGAFMVIVFRGTERERSDIYTDLNARFYKTEAGRAHAGFLSAYDSVDPLLRKSLRRRLCGSPTLPVLLAGHSLGGALATAACARLEPDFEIGAAYTFGSPRVGCEEWSDALKTPVYRVVNGADAVPMVPGGALLRDLLLWMTELPLLAWLREPASRLVRHGFVGFQHAGDLRFVQFRDQRARLKIGSAASVARARCVLISGLGGLLRLRNPLKAATAFRDHSIGRYVTRLRAIAEARNPEPPRSGGLSGDARGTQP